MESTTILADWEWSQSEWDAVAKLYAGYMRAAWLRQIKRGVMASAFFLALGFFLFTMVPTRPGALPGFVGISMFVVIPQAIIGGNWLFDYLLIPRVRAGEMPQVRVGFAGVSLGARTFLWQRTFRLLRVDLVKSPLESEPHTIMARVSFGHGAATLLIPVPRARVEEAERLVPLLNRESGAEPMRAA